MFTENKIFKNPAINGLCDRLYYFIEKNNHHITPKGDLELLLNNKTSTGNENLIQFEVSNDETYQYLLDNLPNIIDGEFTTKPNMLIVENENTVFHFFKYGEGEQAIDKNLGETIPGTLPVGWIPVGDLPLDPTTEWWDEWRLPEGFQINIIMGTLTEIEKSFEVGIKNYATYIWFMNAEWSIEPIEPLNMELQGFFNLGNKLFGQDDYATKKTEILKISNTNLLLAGNYTTNLKLTVTDPVDTEHHEEYLIPININVINPGNIIHNLSNEVNYCLDEELFLTVISDSSKITRIKYKVFYQTDVFDFQNEYAILNNEVKIDIGKPIQPYIYLSEQRINNFFTNFRLDMEPAIVNIEIEFINNELEVIKTTVVGNFRFHAGKSKNLIPLGTTVERSMNYNTVLPLVYQYQEELVNCYYKGNVKTFNKQEHSSLFSIFQMLFFQKYHFIEPYGSAFSSAFDSGFNNPLLSGSDNSYSHYEEGYINKIKSNYIIRGYNFPIQIESFNVVWLDENNHFNGMNFTGSRKDTNKHKFLINKFGKSAQNRKSETLTTKTIILNTGWILKSEKSLLESLVKSKRCWIFSDDPTQRIEVGCLQKKLKTYDTLEELVSFNIAFEVYE